MAPRLSPPRQGFDWSTTSIALSIAGATLGFANVGLILIAVIVFVLGLVAGAVGFRRGVRRNRGAIGIILNAANLLLDAGLVFGASR